MTMIAMIGIGIGMGTATVISADIPGKLRQFRKRRRRGFQPRLQGKLRQLCIHENKWKWKPI